GIRNRRPPPRRNQTPARNRTAHRRRSAGAAKRCERCGECVDARKRRQSAVDAPPAQRVSRTAAEGALAHLADRVGMAPTQTSLPVNNRYCRTQFASDHWIYSQDAISIATHAEVTGWAMSKKKKEKQKQKAIEKALDKGDFDEKFAL